MTCNPANQATEETTIKHKPKAKTSGNREKDTQTPEPPQRRNPEHWEPGNQKSCLVANPHPSIPVHWIFSWKWWKSDGESADLDI